MPYISEDHYAELRAALDREHKRKYRLPLDLINITLGLIIVLGGLVLAVTAFADNCYEVSDGKGGTAEVCH